MSNVSEMCEYDIGTVIRIMLSTKLLLMNQNFMTIVKSKSITLRVVRGIATFLCVACMGFDRVLPCVPLFHRRSSGSTPVIKKYIMMFSTLRPGTGLRKRGFVFWSRFRWLYSGFNMLVFIQAPNNLWCQWFSRSLTFICKTETQLFKNNLNIWTITVPIEPSSVNVKLSPYISYIRADIP